MRPVTSRAGESRATVARSSNLLFASSGIEREIVQAAEELEILRGVRVRVARVGHLIALKLLSRSATRPTDDADLAALAAVADDTARSDARWAVRQIEDRGFGRGRDLVGALEALLPTAG